MYTHTHLYFWMGQNPKIRPSFKLRNFGAEAHVSLPSLMPHSLLGLPGHYVART